MTTTVDAIVVGAGINGLVAAAELAGAGWTVALVDEHERLGGFIASDELTVPGFIHDTYSSWHPLFVSGGAYAVLGADLHRHGLEYCNTDGLVTASVADRGAVIAHRDPAQTAAAFEHPDDAMAYSEMLSELGARSAQVFGVLGSELRPRDVAALGIGALRDLRGAGTRELARIAAQSGRAFTRERFLGSEIDQLWSPWLLHAGIAPDHATGGLMLPLMAMTMHEFGLPVVRGGAARFVDAFRALLTERGVQLYLGDSVDSIDVIDGRAHAVQVGGQKIAATQAILTSTTTGQLYGDLLADPPSTGRRAMRLHRPGRAAMQIHLALNAPVSWSDDRLARVPLVHLSDGSASTGIACAQAEAGLLPSEPTVVVGQQSVLDPSRSPAGSATLWLQLQEVPFQPTGDAAGQITVDGTWNASTTRSYVDRVLARIERYAPGITGSIVGTHVIPPTGLTAANRNAVRGDPYGGAAELDQSLIWRPGTGLGHRTGTDRLWHIGAFTHPGPGLGGGSGHLVAQQLLTPNLADRVKDGASWIRARLDPTTR